jgi:hypothetical protein
MNTSVNQLDISSTNMSQANYFHVNRNAKGPQSTDNTSVIFVGPRTILSRLSTASAALGEVLTSSPPAVNSSYTLQFLGPYVQCYDADQTNQTIASKIQSVMDDNAKALEQTNGITEKYNAYFAYVPDLSDPMNWAQPRTRNTNSSRGSNQLWLAFRRNGTGWTENPYPQCPVTVYQVCQLYNASYDITISFANGIMDVTFNNGDSPEPQNEVDYPPFVVNTTHPSEIPKMSYSAFMWAFTDLLVGSMGLFTETVAYANGTNDTAPFGNILTGLQNTALPGSSDLDCFFAIDWYLNNVTWGSPTGQRLLDINFANNSTLDVLISKLSANITISLMNDGLLA